MNGVRVRPRTWVLFLAAVAAMLTSVPEAAVAAEKGWFLEAGYGVNRHRSDTNSDASTNDKSTRFFAGYQVFSFLAAEIGAVDLSTKTFETAGAELDAETHGYQAKLIGSFPFGGNNQRYNAVFVSAGAWRWDVKASEGASSTRVHGFGPTVGLGLILGGKTGAIKFEYERFISKPDVDPALFASDALDDTVQTDVLWANLMFFL